MSFRPHGAFGSGCARAWLAALVALGLALGDAGSAWAEGPARGDPAARLLDSEVSSDLWEMVVQLESGSWIFAQATVTNAGISDRDAAVVGHVVDARGVAHEFHKVKREGQWRLSEDRRGLDLESIVLELRRPTAHVRVDKARVVLELDIDLTGEAAWSEALTGPAYGFDLLALGAPASGTLQLRGMEKPVAVRGRAALTHRWLGAHESELLRRRAELLAFDARGALYYTEVATAGGELRRWLVAQRDGKISVDSTAVGVEPDRGAGLGAGGPLRIGAAGASVRIDRSRLLLRDEPIARVPWLARWLVSPRARMRSEWRLAQFEVSLASSGSADLELSGTGVITVAHFGSDETSGGGPGE